MDQFVAITSKMPVTGEAFAKESQKAAELSMAANSENTGKEKVEASPDQVVRRLDGVEFVVPEGFDSFEEYISSLSRESLTRAASADSSIDLRQHGILPDPIRGDHPRYVYGVDTNWTKRTDDIASAIKNRSDYDLNSFMDEAFDFFRHPDEDAESYWDRYTAFQDQVYAMSLEIMHQQDAGQGNINTLKSTVTLDGQDYTLKDLVSIQKTLKGFNQRIGGPNYRGYAMAGMATATLKNFAKNDLSEEQGNHLVGLFEKRLQDRYTRFSDSKLPAEFENSRDAKRYYAPAIHDLKDEFSFNADIYQKFSNIDMGANFDQEFSAAKAWFLKGMQGWYDQTGYLDWRVAENMRNINDFMDDLRYRFG